MIFTYSITGTLGPDQISATVDTDSGDFRDRIAWLEEHGAPPNPELLITRNIGLAGDPVLYTGALIWRLKDHAIGTDILLTYRSPEVALVEIRHALGLPPSADAPRYNPRRHDPVPEWMRGNSPIGPPLPGQSGRFQVRDGQRRAEGLIHVGVDGDYELRKTGFAFFETWFWEKR